MVTQRSFPFGIQASSVRFGVFAFGAALAACSASKPTEDATFTTSDASSSVSASASTGQGGASSGAGGSGQGGIDLTTATSGSGGSAPGGDVSVVITADNAYSFGYGDGNGITHFTQGQRAQTAGQIFNCGEGPEAYTVLGADAPNSAYLYIVSWDDYAVTQGVIGQFKRAGASALYTGDPKFEVCATGVDYSQSDTGPALSDINTQITNCNNGSGDTGATSSGWVNGAGAVTPGAVGQLAVGEANDSAPGGTFPGACPTDAAPPNVATIDNAAHWMWYQPGNIADAFHSTGTNTFRAYLIFRVAAQDLPTPK
jgi:hypothetical protein